MYVGHTEYLIGLGFVVIQQYMTVICGTLNKDKSCELRKGPKYKNKATFAKIVNESANYWKHHNEWLSEGQRNYYEKKSDKFFKCILSKNNSCDLHHRLYSTLSDISDNGRLDDVLNIISEWKECL